LSLPTCYTPHPPLRGGTVKNTLASKVKDQSKLATRRRHVATRQQLITRKQIGTRSHTARLFVSIAAEIERDLGGTAGLSRIELELIEAYTAAALLMRNFSARLIVNPEGKALDVAAFQVAASAMVKIGHKLGLRRRQIDCNPDLNQYLAGKKDVDQ
jgi:hypothetical protein